MKVRLYFTLVGKSNEWKRASRPNLDLDFTNASTLDFVRDRVASQFGERALVIVNDNLLKNDARVYPEYYAAGWFISEEDNPRELVVVDHGSSMEEANRAMMKSVSMVDWDSHSVRI